MRGTTVWVGVVHTVSIDVMGSVGQAEAVLDAGNAVPEPVATPDCEADIVAEAGMDAGVLDVHDVVPDTTVPVEQTVVMMVVIIVVPPVLRVVVIVTV